ncbi:MAG: hypothetical protein P5702_08585 [Limnospira sp. PMC 1291.21]|uniref:Uncharacterized protein n=1 Tax=Limnospira fusiformis PMC 851.14 TaxID=2219512 RepID=A0ABU9EMP4_LIMFS|nr:MULTISPECIES: hypothetical protein [Limnospira]EKD05926.1 hypothetical protein SPLC1_S560090 [Arthrospira platensis C1]MDC0838449.1 hypothetical protein [Limnoraphis robusta]MDY7054856.1 hypothetical protein [Limnospira fusiformis LS22]QJB27002.1 hypothetical protein HFV01_15885 [Limnospira fusiformis SAG 85.79]RAQ39787.1 hypothetical protein B9S53_19690 [Arthrospira sp. O9.13F]
MLTQTVRQIATIFEIILFGLQIFEVLGNYTLGNIPPSGLEYTVNNGKITCDCSTSLEREL